MGGQKIGIERQSHLILSLLLIRIIEGPVIDPDPKMIAGLIGVRIGRTL